MSTTGLVRSRLILRALPEFALGDFAAMNRMRSHMLPLRHGTSLHDLGFIRAEHRPELFLAAQVLRELAVAHECGLVTRHHATICAVDRSDLALKHHISCVVKQLGTSRLHHALLSVL